MPKHVSEETIASLLTETGDLEAVQILTQKKTLVRKIKRGMVRKRLSKLRFMVAMDIGEVTFNRLQNPNDIGRVHLETLLKAQTVLGINLVDVGS
jgi:hypothetical protein